MASATQSFALTKIQPPRARASLVARERLEERMTKAALARRLVLIAAPAGGGDQRFRIGAPRRIERLERGDQAGEQAERIVVDIGRDPGHRRLAAQPLDQPRQRRGLAEAGRRGDEDEAARQRGLRHALLEPLARDQAGAGSRRLDLGECEALRGRCQGASSEAYFAVTERPPRVRLSRHNRPP